MNKKLIALIFIFICILTLTSCGDNTQQRPKLGVLSSLGCTEEEKASIIKDIMVDKAFEDQLSTLPDYVVVYFEDFNSMIMSLDRGDIDAIYMTKSFWRYINELYPDKYTPPENTSKIAFALCTLEENKDICDEVSKAIDTLRDEGILDLLKIDYIDYYGSRNIEDTIKIPFIEGAKTYTVAVTGDLPPMDYISTNGYPCGYNIALLSELSKIMNVNFDVISTTSGSRTIMLTSGKADFVFWTSGYEDIIDDGYIFTSDVPEGVCVTSAYFIDQISDVKLNQ